MASSLDTLDSMSYNKESVVRGNHVYKTVWTPFIGESLVVNCEIDNSHDSYAVTWKTLNSLAAASFDFF